MQSHINIYSGNTQKHKNLANTHNKDTKVC